MKVKKIFTIVTLLAILTTLVPFAGAATEAEPFTTDLIAGQHIDVGEVQVWNDAEYLYVRYLIDVQDWVISETHLMVAESVDGIPQTEPNKQGKGGGNPIPGHFEYTNVHDPMVTEYTYQIPLTWDPTEAVAIAAHAVVCMYDYDSITFASGTDVQVTSGNVPESVYPYPAVLTWVHPNWNTAILPYVYNEGEWIWESYYVNDPHSTESVTFEQVIDIPGVPTGGAMQITTDNKYEVLLNGVSIGTDATWQNVEQLPLGYLHSGLNTLTIIGENLGVSGSSVTSNPAGVIYEGHLCYRYIAKCETAWGAGEDFPGSNWATYFTYFECYPELFKTVYAKADGTESSSTMLYSGKTYLIEASGMMTWKTSGPYNTGDAAFWQRPYSTVYDWDGDGEYGDEPEGYWDIMCPTGGLGFASEPSSIDWDGDEVNLVDHKYTITYTPSVDGPVSFKIFDNNYADNSDIGDGITVSIYEIICP